MTRAVPFSSTRSLAVTSPITWPCTTRIAARTVASTTPRSPMMSVSWAVISPRSFASSITVPAQVYLPSISEFSSRKAPRPPRIFRALPFRFRHMISPPTIDWRFVRRAEQERYQRPAMFLATAAALPAVRPVSVGSPEGARLRTATVTGPVGTGTRRNPWATRTGDGIDGRKRICTVLPVGHTPPLRWHHGST